MTIRLGRALGVCLALATGWVQAAQLSYSFNASLDTGPLQGTTFAGTIAFDPGLASGAGQEYLTLTALAFTLSGTSFTQADIRQGGQAILQDGKLQYFTAALFPASGPVSDIAFGFGGPGVIGYAVPSGLSTFGSGTYRLSASPVPESSTRALLVAGLSILATAGAGTARKAKRAAKARVS